MCYPPRAGVCPSSECFPRDTVAWQDDGVSPEDPARLRRRPAPTDIRSLHRCRKRFITTLACLAIFLVCSQLPLYGIKASTGADPLYWARMIMASSRGTVMELGTGPIITAGLIMQLLVGSKLIDVDNNVKTDRDLM